MGRPQVAVVGSVDESRIFDPPVNDPSTARLACEEIGSQLASAGWDLIVYSSDLSFIEPDVVRGYIESGQAGLASIHVHAPLGKGGFMEQKDHPQVFDARPDPSGDWEVSFYRSLSHCDGVLVVGGGRSTLVTGVLAIAQDLPIMAAAQFGGSGRKIWERMSNGTTTSDEDLADMARAWDAGAAARLVESIERQRAKRVSRARTAARLERAESRRALTSLTVAAVLLLAAVAGLICVWGWRPALGGSITVLTLAPALAAAGGALIRTSLDVGREWVRAAVLGGAAGLITGLLYTASQLIGAPDILENDRNEAVRRLLFFVLPIGFIAGLTFDAVYSKLRGRDVSQIATINKILTSE